MKLFRESFIQGFDKEYILHGTEAFCLTTIFEGGFNVGFDTNAIYGKGAYGSPDVLTELGYGYNIVDCEVFYGNTGVDQGQENVPPVKLGYDTTTAQNGRIVCFGNPQHQMKPIALVRLERYSGIPRDPVTGGTVSSVKAPLDPVTGGAVARVKAPVVPVAHLAAVATVGLPGFGHKLVVLSQFIINIELGLEDHSTVRNSLRVRDILE